jgi:hypothetical protein
MGQITRDCPHCGTRKVAFTSYGEAKKTHSNVWVAAFRCGGCFGGIIVEIETGVRDQPHGYDGDVEAFQHFRVLWPSKTRRRGISSWSRCFWKKPTTLLGKLSKKSLTRNYANLLITY